MEFIVFKTQIGKMQVTTSLNEAEVLITLDNCSMKKRIKQMGCVHTGDEILLVDVLNGGDTVYILVFIFTRVLLNLYKRIQSVY